MAASRGKQLVGLSLSKANGEKENDVCIQKQKSASSLMQPRSKDRSRSPVHRDRSRSPRLTELQTLKLGLLPHETYTTQAWLNEWMHLRHGEEDNNPSMVHEENTTQATEQSSTSSLAGTIKDVLNSVAGDNNIVMTEFIPETLIADCNPERASTDANNIAPESELSTVLNMDPIVTEADTPQEDTLAQLLLNNAPDWNQTSELIPLAPSPGNASAVLVTNDEQMQASNNMDLQGDDRGEESVPPKRRRSSGQKIKHNLNTRNLLPPCSQVKCRKKCQDKISESDRNNILHNFWSLDFSQRSLFLDGHINIHAPKVGKGTKTKSLVYCLQNDTGLKIDVCKTMFLSTLGLKTDGMITEFLKRKSNTSIMSDQRGRSEPTNKLDHEGIISHINSYNPSTSHYRQAHAPGRRYLDCYLTVDAMHKDFLSKGGRASYETYRSLFAKQKISFGYPPQDECELCETFKAHNHGDKTADECDTCIKHDAHIKRAQDARSEYRREPEIDVDVFTADMQKIILLPKMMTKEHFFVSRLVVFNETFARKSEGEDLVVLWHEGIAGRSAAEVASSYIKVLELTNKPHVLIWADNCSAQNKNWTLYSALVATINEEWAPETVTIKYLEKGHTFMKADSIHGAIGTKMKKEKEIITFEDFVRLCQKANNNIKTVELRLQDFYTFKALHRTNSNKTVKMPKLHDVVQVTFVKGKRTFSCREGSFSAPLREVNFLKPSAIDDISMPPKASALRGLQQKKKDGIISLLRATSNRAGLRFWTELPVNNNSKDLIESVTVPE